MDSRPDRAFRIADRRHPIFDGTGAFLKGARWNSPGRPVIYAAETFAGALLEMLVHTRIGRIPRTHAAVEIAIPPDVSIEYCHPEQVDFLSAEAARAFGDAWHHQRRSLILVVPSVAASGRGRNVLINADHSQLGVLRVSEPFEIVWDARLFQY
jgi:RES domain-containing protein